MKRFADRCRAPRCAAFRPCVVISTFVLVAACDHVALPSQLIARGVARADTIAAPPAIDTVATGGDTIVVADTVVAAAAVDSSEADPATGPVAAVPAELPRDAVDTRYPVAGRTVRLAADADLQAAIDSALPGDELLLPRGATYVGNFYLPDKGPSNAWIVLRTDVSDTELGAEGTRMTPSRARALGLASIISPNANSVVVTGLGANHFRFTAVEISSAERVDEINALVRFGDNTSDQHDAATTAHHLVIDRSYLHGEPAMQLRRCVMLNSATSAVVDSWLADCHSNVSDSQAIIGWNGPGPYLIQNDHLEGGHEVVMFGGGGVTTPGVSPSDVTIRGNHVMRPPTWKGIWQVKNLLEMKHVRRLLVEGNVFENNWADAQAGFAFVLKSENQTWDTPWTQSTDITIRYNRVRNTGNGWNLAANPSGAPAVPAARIAITDNVLEDVNASPFDGEGKSIQLLGGLSDIVIAHNSVVSAPGGSASAITLGTSSPITRLAVHSNILVYGAYGVKGDGIAAGRASLATYATGALFTRNVIVGGGVARDYPGGNFFVPTLADAGISGTSPHDYHLTVPTFRGRGLDDRDIGADIDRVDAATRGAVVAP